MITCLNLVTLGQHVDQRVGASAAADAGFDAVGIWAEPIQKHSKSTSYAQDLASMCQSRDLRIAELCFVGGWMWSDEEALDDALEQANRRAELANAANCPVVIAPANAGTGDVDRAAADFYRLCEIGAEFDVVFALEYLGMAEQINDLRAGLDIVRRADHPNGKLLIDTFHTFRGGSSVEEFSLPQSDEVGLVHVNDVPQGDLQQMVDSDRAMPGGDSVPHPEALKRVMPEDGSFPLRQAFSRLQESGYDGVLSVELFSEYWWDQPMERTAQAALEGLKAVMP